MSRFEQGGEEFYFGEFGYEYQVEGEGLGTEEVGLIPEAELGRERQAPLGSQRASLPWNLEARIEAERGELSSTESGAA